MIYDTISFGCAIFFIILAIILIIVPIVLVKKYRYEAYIFCPTLSGTLIFGIYGLFLFSIAFEKPTPKDIDVIEGKAEYVETITILKGDTIRTYHIEWKE